jgi:hypothetical protein
MSISQVGTLGHLHGLSSLLGGHKLTLLLQHTYFHVLLEEIDWIDLGNNLHLDVKALKD